MTHNNQHINGESLRRRLKELTFAFHAELESTPVAIRLASGTIEREEYGLYLQRVAALHQMLEPHFIAMDEWKAYGINPLQRTRIHLLNHDLSALGDVIALQKAISPLVIPLNFATAVGMMYVLEGSTMGGQILVHKVSHILGSDGLPCTRYFAAYRENTMKLWGEFCQFLDRFGTENPQAASEVILGACAMFLMIQKEMHELL